jgi:ATPase family associated with various cellular activities (AAA)
MVYESKLSVVGTEAPTPGRPDGRLEAADAGRLFRRARRCLIGLARADERDTLARRLWRHLGGQADTLPVVAETWPAYEQVNVQLGLDAWLAGKDAEWVGVIGFHHRDFGLADLLSETPEPYGPRPGNLARTAQPAGPDGETVECVQCAVVLVAEPGRRTALLVREADPSMGLQAMTVQLVSTDPAYAAEAGAELRRLAVARNVFRGQVLSFGADVFRHGSSLLRFHRRPVLGAEQLVLPAGTLAAVRRQVVDVARHKERLLAAGQHLKRGLLLYGPPGVGKTHTVRHLTASLTGTTVIQLTGDALHLVAEACSVARALQPSMVVVEDVDLIAEDRGMHPGQHPMLFQLLNEMDGLAEDADVVFVLTTNRADLLEPALASRPGRVDQAVELQLPDLAARRALFELYRGSLPVDTARLDGVLERASGVTASFLKELLRRAATLAADRPGPLAVSADDLDAALEELLDTRNAMTRTLLGSSPEPAPAPVTGPVPGVAPASASRPMPDPPPGRMPERY